jgi:hypothetical protein
MAGGGMIRNPLVDLALCLALGLTLAFLAAMVAGCSDEGARTQPRSEWVRVDTQLWKRCDGAHLVYQTGDGGVFVLANGCAK